MGQSGEILGLSKTKTQQGQHPILQLHAGIWGFGLTGPGPRPSTFAAWDTRLSLGRLPSPYAALGQMLHSSGIFNILASSLQAKFHLHSSM